MLCKDDVRDDVRAYYMYIQCQHLAYASINIFNGSFFF